MAKEEKKAPAALPAPIAEAPKSWMERNGAYLLVFGVVGFVLLLAAVRMLGR